MRHMQPLTTSGGEVEFFHSGDQPQYQSSPGPARHPVELCVHCQLWQNPCCGCMTFMKGHRTILAGAAGLSPGIGAGSMGLAGSARAMLRCLQQEMRGGHVGNTFKL